MKLIDRKPTPEMIEAMHERGATLTGMFQAAYDAAPEVKQEPVAIVDANDEGYWADILPDRSVKVGQPLFAYPPDAQAEIVERIKELEQELQTTADALAEVEQIRLGLENVRLFAARHRKEDWALLILGFCSEAGVVGSALR